ncbi:hypothetical protein JF535_16340 [Microbulbifer salipaludis]|uniref:Phage holin family protein n=1 Tax=Microbulbifer salipaludis TaxID=187980 RepID=A0ABS3EAS9_9GAMM|nr:hypothetical protein [Microbulbifer salipaludis]MBN8432412.1 hypothetical protein [Microbulbifer salipaludis]
MAGSEKPEQRQDTANSDAASTTSKEGVQQSPDPAADTSGRAHYAEKDAGAGESISGIKTEIDALVQRAEATMTLATAWSENFTRLVQLEFQRTLSAGKRIVVLLLFLFFLAVALIVSLCAGLGLLGYYFFQSIYLGFGIFFLSQLLVFSGLLLSINRLRGLLGFEESKKQVNEALNDVTALFKQTD